MQTDWLDEIKIDNLVVFANHGVFPEETRLGQKFLLSMTLYVDAQSAGYSDNLNHSVNYGDVSQFSVQWMQKNTFALIEAAAEQLCNAILERYPLVKGLTLELKKPWAPVGLPLDSVSVKISRFRHIACIALGSNMGDKKAYLDQAADALDKLPGSHVRKVSSYLVTAPYGGVEQDDFLNAALLLETTLNPQTLLEELHRIEQAANRKRIVRWGPRTLDLDILLYDDLVMSEENLIIPHVEMHKRDFVLLPLCEIAPYMRHPILEKTVEELKNQVCGSKTADSC